MNEGRRNFIVVWIVIAPLIVLSWIGWLIRLPLVLLVKGVEKVCSWVDTKMFKR